MLSFFLRFFEIFQATTVFTCFLLFATTAFPLVASSPWGKTERQWYYYPCIPLLWVCVRYELFLQSTWQRISNVVIGYNVAACCRQSIQAALGVHQLRLAYCFCCCQWSCGCCLRNTLLLLLEPLARWLLFRCRMLLLWRMAAVIGRPTWAALSWRDRLPVPVGSVFLVTCLTRLYGRFDRFLSRSPPPIPLPPFLSLRCTLSTKISSPCLYFYFFTSSICPGSVNLMPNQMQSPWIHQQRAVGGGGVTGWCRNAGVTSSCISLTIADVGER